MNPTNPHAINRRQWLLQAGAGFGGLALMHMLSQEGALGDVIRSEWNGGLHHAPKAKRVVQLFMNGGVSQIDSFDYKPMLARRHGEKVDFGIKKAATSDVGALMGSPFEFKQHGQCGRCTPSQGPRRH